MTLKEPTGARGAVPWGWVLGLAGATAAVVTLAALPDTAAQGFPLLPPSPGALAILGQASRTGLGVALSIVVLLGVPWAWALRRTHPARFLAGTWSVLAAGGAWAWQGYPYNRYEIGALWRETARVAGIPVPRALLDGDAWLHNAGLTLGAVALAFALAWGLERLLDRVQFPRAPRAVGIAGAALVLLLLPPALRPAAWGRPLPAGPDVIVISLDAVRADRLGCYGYSGGTTPALDALARRAVRFTRAYCQEPWTLTSHMSMLTGLYPDVHGLDFGRSLAPSVWTLPELLREAGYRTWGSVYDCFLLDPRFGYASGFDAYTVSGESAAQRAEKAARWLLADDRPGFVFLHLYDTHSDTGALPYESGLEYRERFAPGASTAFEAWSDGTGASEALRRVNEGELELPEDLREKLSQLYDAGLAETDAAVGAFLDRLEAAGRLDSSLIVVLADHGEALGEREHFMHEKLMEATLRIPLLVHWPEGVRAGSQVDALTETVDVAPTILAATGVAARGVVQGHDLGADFVREVAHHRSGPDYAVTSADRWRLSYRWIDGAPHFEALRRVGDDPADGPDLLAEHPDVVDRLLDPVVDHHEANAVLARQQRGAEVGMSEADRDLLRSLGYID